MRITILDYGVGNLHSLQKALVCDGVSVHIATDPARSVDTDLLVLPGVGSFGRAAEYIAPARARLRSAIADGLPVLGVCLGMQLLFPSSEEGAGQGLGVFEGRVDRLRATRIPQMGWNGFEEATDALFDVARLDTAYYANSFVCRVTEEVMVGAWSRHDDDRFPAMVRMNRTIGVQFHPEKSSAAGVRFLRAAVQELTR